VTGTDLCRRRRVAVAARWATTLMILAGGGARAYRPFDQTDSDVAELHVIELEIGLTQLQWSQGRTELVPTFIFNLGVMPRWELVVDTAGSALLAGPREQGEVAQLEVGVSLKGVLREGSLQGGEGLSVAIEPELLLPATAGPSGFGFEAGVILSQRWPALTVHLNLVPLWSREHRPGGQVGFIIEGPATWTVRPVAETYVEVERGEQAPTYSGLVGVIWHASALVAPDVAVRAASTSGTGLIEVRVGLTWDLPL